MSTLQTFAPHVRQQQPQVDEEEALAACRRQMMRGEIYALAVLVGLQLSVVYVIGTLVVACVGS
jgi:hypothetical protein